MSTHLYPKEAEIMRLWDAGASIETIACNVGMAKLRVGSIVAAFDGACDERVDRAAMRRGSAFLLRAIQLSGKRHGSVAR